MSNRKTATRGRKPASKKVAKRGKAVAIETVVPATKVRVTPGKYVGGKGKPKAEAIGTTEQPTPMTWTEIKRFGLQIDPGNTDPVPLIDLAKLAADVAAMQQQANTIGENLDRYKNELSNRIEALERIVTPAPADPKGEPTVAELAKRHGLNRSCLLPHMFTQSGLDSCGSLSVNENTGCWYVFGVTNQVGDRTTLAAALAKYAPIKPVTRVATPDEVAILVAKGEANRLAKGDAAPTVKPDLKVAAPDATPEERRAELERRGLKWSSHYGDYSLSGTPEANPHAFTDGEVCDKHGDMVDGKRTRTLPEFCAALDKVGLVKQVDPLDAPLTREVFEAECKGRPGLKAVDPAGTSTTHVYTIGGASAKDSGFRCWWYGGYARWSSGYCKEVNLPIKTLRDLRAVLDRELPPLVGDGPWTVEQLNAAGIRVERACIVEDCGTKGYVLFNARPTDNSGDPVTIVFRLDRRRLLHAANDPDVNPEWAARVRKALGMGE